MVGEKSGGGTRTEEFELAPRVNCGNHIGPAEAYRIGVDEESQSPVWHIVCPYFDKSARGKRDMLRGMGFCVAHTLPEKTPDME